MDHKLPKWKGKKMHVKGAVLNWVRVMSIIPQGLVSGPLLVMVYVNCVPEGLESQMNMFVVDVKIMRKARSLQGCENHKRDLDRLQLWPHTWLMRFNPSKYKLFEIGQRKRRPNKDCRLTYIIM